MGPGRGFLCVDVLQVLLGPGADLQTSMLVSSPAALIARAERRGRPSNPLPRLLASWVPSPGAGAGRPLRSQSRTGLITGQQRAAEMTSASRGRRRLLGEPKAEREEREEPELVLESLQHVQVLPTDVNIPYAAALVYLPDVAGGPLWNVNYTDFLLGMNSSPRLRPPPCVHLLLLLRETTGPGQTPVGRAGVREPRGSAAGRRNSGPVQLYCYLPKRANYIWSPMWNLFCSRL